MSPARLLILLILLVPYLAHADAQWIWLPSPEDGSGAIQHEFEIDQAAAPTLHASVDFCRAEISLNDAPLTTLHPYGNPQQITLDLPLLESGRHTLRINVEAIAGPSAFALELRLEDGTPLVTTDETWLAEGLPVKTFGMVMPERLRPPSLNSINPFDEYNQWREAGRAEEVEGATAADEVTFSGLPPGFEIELLREALPEEDSWVSMCRDSQGRFIIAREKRGLLRFTIPEDSTEEIAVEVIDDTLLECRGLLWHEGALYANANNSKALYRLRDTTGDDQFDEVQLLQETEGGVGHGRNDLATGPDGMLYLIHGDSVQVPESATWWTAPESKEITAQGHMIRTNAEGSIWQVLSRGIRNPYGIAFNRDGEPFTYDADNEGDIGLPLYRPTRVNHLVAGGNYGWRQASNTWSWPDYTPDALPTTVDIGRGSPTAVAFGYESNFPEIWKDALYVLDWAYGRILAVHLQPRGASYSGAAETFLRGRPLNVTDMDFDTEGNMLFVTGGRKTQSALYRVRYIGGAVPTLPPSEQAARRAEFSREARERRKALEQFLPNPPEDIWPHVQAELGSADPWLRNIARVLLERAPIDTWKDAALRLETTRLDGLTSRLALIRASADPLLHENLVMEIVETDLSVLDEAERLILFRILELGLDHADEHLAGRIAYELSSIYPNASAPQNREICKLLVRCGSPEVIAKTFEWYAREENQLHRLHALEQLSHLETGWAMDQREIWAREFVGARRFARGDRNLPGFLNDLRDRFLSHVSNEVQKEQLLAILDPQPEESEPIEPREFVRNWLPTDIPELLEALGSADPTAGPDLYKAAQCSRCHVFETTGNPVGPNLTTVRYRFSPEDLLMSILHPSEVVADPYPNHIFRMKDGAVLSGRIIRDDFRESMLQVAMDPFAPENLTPIQKSDISSYEESPLSPMPIGLLNTLDQEEVASLITWLMQPSD